MLTCKKGGRKINAKFYDEFAGGKEIESAEQLPSGDYAIIFTVENETNVTCGVDSSRKSAPLPIVGKSSLCIVRTLKCIKKLETECGLLGYNELPL